MRVWIFSAFASALIMFVLSYVWHGLVLTDIEKLSVPLSNYLILSVCIYFLIGLLMVFLIIKLRKKYHTRYLGLFVGLVVGFLVYSVAITQNAVFHSSQIEHIILDYFWQMTEQGIGGIAAAKALSFFGAWKKSF